MSGDKIASKRSSGILGLPDPAFIWEAALSPEIIPDELLLRPDFTALVVAAGQGTEAIVLAKRMIDLGIPKDRVNNAITLIDKYNGITGYLKNKKKFANVITADFLDCDMNTEFDVVIGNPPYNRGILPKEFKSKIARGNASIAFIEECIKKTKDNGICSLVLPTNFMTLPSMKAARDFIASSVEILKIKIYDNTEQQIFPIDNDNILVLTFQKKSNPNNTQVCVEREHFITKQSNNVIVDITKYSFWPMYLSEIEKSILDKVLAKRSGPLLFSKTNYFIFLAVMGDNNSLNHTKHWSLNHTRDSVKCGVMFYFNSEKDSEMYHNFSKSTLYNLVLTQIKSTPKNQPEVLSYIGSFNFIDDDYYSFFGLTQEEIDYIEKTIK